MVYFDCCIDVVAWYTATDFLYLRSPTYNEPLNDKKANFIVIR